MCNPSHRALLNVMISMSGTFYGMKILSHQWQLDHQLRKTGDIVRRFGFACRSHSQGGEAGRPSGQAPTKYELAIDLKIAKDRGWDHEESCRPVGR